MFQSRKQNDNDHNNVMITTTNLTHPNLHQIHDISAPPDKIALILSKGHRLSALESSALAPTVAIRPNALDLQGQRRREAQHLFLE